MLDEELSWTTGSVPRKAMRLIGEIIECKRDRAMYARGLNSDDQKFLSFCKRKIDRINKEQLNLEYEYIKLIYDFPEHLAEYYF